LLSPLEAARYVDEFNSPWVAWHFDIGNVITYGWPNNGSASWVNAFRPCTSRNFSRKRRDEERPREGVRRRVLEGAQRLAVGDEALDDIGYEGWASPNSRAATLWTA